MRETLFTPFDYRDRTIEKEKEPPPPIQTLNLTNMSKKNRS